MHNFEKYFIHETLISNKKAGYDKFITKLYVTTVTIRNYESRLPPHTPRFFFTSAINCQFLIQI